MADPSQERSIRQQGKFVPTRAAKGPAAYVYVHGVGGADPEELLSGRPMAVLYNKVGIGIFQATGEEGVSGASRPRYAFLWGGLTSGSDHYRLEGWKSQPPLRIGPLRLILPNWLRFLRAPSRALWLCSMPFTIINVAGFMSPPAPHESHRRSAREIRYWTVKAAGFLSVGLALAIIVLTLSALLLTDCDANGCRSRGLFGFTLNSSYYVTVILGCLSLAALGWAVRPPLREAETIAAWRRLADRGTDPTPLAGAPWWEGISFVGVFGFGFSSSIWNSNLPYKELLGSDIEAKLALWLLAIGPLIGYFIFWMGFAILSRGLRKNTDGRHPPLYGPQLVGLAPLLLVAALFSAALPASRIEYARDLYELELVLLLVSIPLIAGSVALGLGLTKVAFWFSRECKLEVARVQPDYSAFELPERDLKGIARDHVLARLPDQVPQLLTWFSAGFVVGIPLIPIGVLSGGLALAIATWCLAGLGSMYLGLVLRAVYSKAWRRRAALVWDVLTFWPAGYHPFAAPHVAASAVRDLEQFLARTLQHRAGAIVWSHSQGSVISALAIAGLTLEQRKRIVFITCGSPLSRLYVRYFPSYFSRARIVELAGSLRAWHNWWRPTDYIGGPIFEKDDLLPISSNVVDSRIADPSDTELIQRNRRPYRHSEYWSEPVIVKRARVWADRLDAEADRA